MKKYLTAYKHYLNEDALNSITNSKVFRRLTWYWNLAMAISIFPELLLGGFGIRINLTKVPENIFFFMALGLLALSLINTAVFLFIANKYHFFKRKSILLVIAFSPLAAVITSFLTSFTAIRTVNADGVVQYNHIIHVLFQLLVATPLFVIYIIFCYYAFYDRCCKMANILLRKEMAIHKQELDESTKKLKEQTFLNITYKYHALKAKKNKKKEDLE